MQTQDNSSAPAPTDGGAGFISATHHALPEPTPVPQEESLEPANVVSDQAPPVNAPQVNEPPVEEASVPDELGAKYADLDQYFEKRFGHGLQDIVEMLQDLGTFRQETVHQQQVRTLQEEWGSQFDDYFGIVKERFAKLPPEHQAAYDNVDGARRLLAEHLMLTGQFQQPRPQNVRQRQVRQPANQQKSYDFRASEIREWAQSDFAKYDANRDAITRAYQLGRVLPD